MVDIDLRRAKNLLISAKDISERGDIYGVAGLAYQAFESATIALMEKVNGQEQTTHFARRKRAKELLADYRDKIDILWEVRNVDFYGNVKIGNEKREISREEVMECLALVEDMISEIEKLLEE